MRTLAAAVIASLALAPSTRGDEPGGYGKTQGLLPGVLVGPRLNVVSLPPGVGVDVKTLGNALGLSLDVGIVPKVHVGQVHVSWSDLSVGAKFYPWRGRFYLGARAGSRSFRASAQDTSTGLEAKADVTSTYLAPELGWRFVWDSGVYMGLELGYQIVLATKETLDIPGSVDPTKQKDVRDAADQIGKIGLPILTLLQVGWFF
jgi:hypothetical protein